MFSHTQFNGSSLPRKTICLTFDDGPGETNGDGPGPRTIPLAEYLASENITATFFLVGKHIAQYPKLPQRILELGHIIGNHTYNHPDFLKPQTFINDETAVSEIAKTERLIADTYKNTDVYFRAPYGSWSAEIADTLNRNLITDINYIGPIGWDVNENDWLYWLQAQEAKVCATAYLSKIIEVDHGIIVMHDSTSDNDIMKANNRTFETVKILIPRLKNLGYNFVGLNKVPGIQLFTALL